MGTYTDVNPRPLADQANWSLVFEDRFNGTGIDHWKWPIIYGGSTYWNGAFQWDRSDVSVGSGELRVLAERTSAGWTAGGLSTLRWDLNRADGFDFTYGRVEVRAAIDAGKGTGPAILLWPFDNTWPPEIDLVETPDGRRRSQWFSNHWKEADGDHASHSVQIKSVDSKPFDYSGTAYDGTKWHTYTVDWLPGKLRYHIDGVKVYETPAGEPVSAMPMALGLQMFVAAANDGWYGGGPDNSTPSKVNLHVDYIRVYESAATRLAQERGTAPSLTVSGLHVVQEADGTMQLREAVGGQDGGPPGLDVARAVRAERVAGTPADDVMGGRAGAAIFVPGRGRDRVEGFTSGEDRLLLDGEPRQVHTFFVAQDGRDVLMVLHGDMGLVALPGVTMLGAGDLVFA